MSVTLYFKNLLKPPNVEINTPMSETTLECVKILIVF